MAITDIIPREPQSILDEEGPFTHLDPIQETIFQQHGCTIPSTDTVLARTPIIPGGETVDRNLNMLIPELTDPIRNPAFAADPASLPTPDRCVPDRVWFRRGPVEVEQPLPNGGTILVWPFQDRDPVNPAPLGFPSATLRCVEGELVHLELSTRNNTHTIHMHAIEPTAMNDGVGHITFEVGGGVYRYQMLASEAGTYIYHCHKNTTLHFEMGMYGFLIVDPPQAGGQPFRDGGPGVIRRGNGFADYDVEALWAVDEIDSAWHLGGPTGLIGLGQGHSAGIVCPFYNVDDTPANGGSRVEGIRTGAANPGLHDFRPDIFMISGIADAWTMPNVPGSPFPNGAAVIANQGQKILIRLLHAGYNVHKYTFGLPLEVIGIDGRTLGFGEFMRYSRPFTVPANKTFPLTVARRWDLFIDTATIAAGAYPVNIKFFDWITDRQTGELNTQIIIR